MDYLEFSLKKSNKEHVIVYFWQTKKKGKQTHPHNTFAKNKPISSDQYTQHSPPKPTWQNSYTELHISTCHPAYKFISCQNSSSPQTKTHLLGFHLSKLLAPNFNQLKFCYANWSYNTCYHSMTPPSKLPDASTVKWRSKTIFICQDFKCVLCWLKFWIIAWCYVLIDLYMCLDRFLIEIYGCVVSFF